SRASAGALLLSAISSAHAYDVLTSREDDARTGVSLSETLLTPAAIDAGASPGQFGKLFTYSLSFAGQQAGDIYAQPLYLSNIGIPGQGMANMLLIATMGNYLFALDADGPIPGGDGILWERSLGVAPTVADIWKNCSQSSPCLFTGSNIRGTAG